MKFDRKTIIVALVVVVIMCLCTDMFKTSGYTMSNAALVDGDGMASLSQDAPVSGEGTKINLIDIGCAMNAGTGLASSLLPQEVKGQEDYSEFSPERILEGQNFLDPRNQIGFPETIGGTLRNANQQIRADPPNPKQVYEWNNSTIVPDLMQRKICT